MPKLTDWVDPDNHGWIIQPGADAEWQALLDEYGGDTRGARPLGTILDAVRASGCQTVVVENRYVDPDYRSEYAAFWTRRFQGKPAFARRLHFFADALDEADLHKLPEGAPYLGYAVLKPNAFGAVGRSVVTPPPNLSQAALALARDEVTLFGNRLEVVGAPFCEQDGEYLRCAHAAAWMCHYSAARRDLVARRNTAELVEATPQFLSPDRPLPSKGLNLNQLQAVFGAFGQPALFYGLSLMPRVRGVADPPPQTDANGDPLPPGYWDTRIFSVICRYLNSGYPVLIGTSDHAFVIVGWFKDGSDIRFVVNDDQRGVYGVVDSPFTDQRAPWRSIMVPLPPKVFLSGEAAENDAHRTLSVWGARQNVPAQWQELANGLAAKDVSLRTVLQDGSHYKHRLMSRGVPDAATRVLRLARFPHYVWVVEAHDRNLRDAGQDHVIGEVVYDATSHDARPMRCALVLPGVTVAFPPDDASGVGELIPVVPWASSLPLNDW